MSTPGFLKNGIDFKQLVSYYLANNCHIEITDLSEVDVVIKLMKHVIDKTRCGYDSIQLQDISRRFQMIFNSALEEFYISKTGLNKKSNAIWLLESTYETGSDFYSNNGKQIEAKVYKDFDSMTLYAEKGSNGYTVFHGADYVLCYLINSYDSKHWWWLKKVNNTYDICNDSDLNTYTQECLPTSIPICYCVLEDAKFIIFKNTFCL